MAGDGQFDRTGSPIARVCRTWRHRERVRITPQRKLVGVERHRWVRRRAPAGAHAAEGIESADPEVVDSRSVERAAQFVLIDRIQKEVRDRERDRLGPAVWLHVAEVQVVMRGIDPGQRRLTRGILQHGIGVVIHVARDIDRLGAKGVFDRPLLVPLEVKPIVIVPLFRPTVVVSAAPNPTRIVVSSVACPARLITLAVPWLASPVTAVNGRQSFRKKWGGVADRQGLAGERAVDVDRAEVRRRDRHRGGIVVKVGEDCLGRRVVGDLGVIRRAEAGQGLNDPLAVPV